MDAPLGLVDVAPHGEARPQLWLVRAEDAPTLREQLPAPARAWLEAIGFRAKPGSSALLPDASGNLLGTVTVVGDPGSPFEAARARQGLPAGCYRLAPAGAVAADFAALGFALEHYRYERPREPVPLLEVEGSDPAMRRATRVAAAVHFARDLVNAPANRLGPAELADGIVAEAQRLGAEVEVVTGDDLLTRGFPAVHVVGAASARAPRLVDLRWGDPTQPKLTLVGKGVCFDTGGLDVKPSSGMLLMKKDMGGAAVMLALARLVMECDLPVRLRLLVPCVENAISGSAFRPGDVIATRKGLRVEIGNTDAEGRLILADALAAAGEEEVDLLLDAATLTGAARVALGPELPALFTPDDGLAAEFVEAAMESRDPLWRMPLHQPYAKMLESPFADLNNTGSGGFAGAITAALFLQRFVEGQRWAHLDVFAHNSEGKPGRPKGGEATALLASYRLLERRYRP